MEFKDYYVILGVELSVGEVEIKIVYCWLVCKYYLDVSKEVGVEDKFKVVNEVYEVLCDLEKCVVYD